MNVTDRQIYDAGCACCKYDVGRIFFLFVSLICMTIHLYVCLNVRFLKFNYYGVCGVHLLVYIIKS